MERESNIPALRLRALPVLLASLEAGPTALAFFRTLARFVVALAGVEKPASVANSCMSTWMDDVISGSAIVGLEANRTSGFDFIALHIAQRISTSRAVRLLVLVVSPAMLAEGLWMLEDELYCL